MNISAEQFRHWYRYETDVHSLTLESLETVPAARRDDRYQAALDLYAHLLAARRMWLHRLGAAASGPEAPFPKGAALAALRAESAAVHQLWAGYLERLTDAEVDRVFEYRSTEGPRYRNTVGEILTQLFGHSWYHRGQIAALVRACGGQPAVTDFVFWSRAPVPG